MMGKVNIFQLGSSRGGVKGELRNRMVKKENTTKNNF